jgi:glycosyltransferase involved in cell wall biosynthesis
MNMPKWRERPVTLNIYGKGPDEEAFRSLVAGFGLTNVVFHGHVSDIPGIWRVNHLLLMSSFMEGLPLVLIAAMMCGRVPVVTNIGAHSEVIVDNETGFIAGSPSVADLDDALERAWNRRQEWPSIGDHARTFIHRYIPEDPVGHFLSLLRQQTPPTTKREAN